MAIAIVGIGVYGAPVDNDATTFSLALPTEGESEGDLLFAICSKHSVGKTITAPGGDGWTLLDTQTSVTHAIFWKTAGASESDPKTFGCDTWTHGGGAIIAVSGGGTPTAGSREYNATWDTSLELPSTVIGTDGSAVLWVGTMANDDACNTTGCTRGSAVEQLDHARSGTNDHSLFIWSELGIASATLSSETLTINTDSGDKTGMAIVIPPAASGPFIPARFLSANKSRLFTSPMIRA